ncbi:hypothetical protein [Polyangium spumosum]|uniref:Protein kinase domain-containing protein n=1 Tax=Polyangium spumosum TaxID=889282 RepID=A0A6N7PK16_9BACT|nr:hypothetical protein [Polyangium spumosum]MRG90485.1 hypothetical protein [Polyangium spumosum]
MSITPGTLRAEMEARRASGRTFDLKESLSVLVPLCTEIGELHREGKALFVHPSAILYTGTAVSLLEDKAEALPELPADRACIAPECRKGTPGDARASVFSIGAILYEMLTSGSVGPGMKRPTDVVPDLPASLEMILGKALVADAKHRPADLGALAQALHNVAPGASVAPPPTDAGLDDGVEIDVAMSLIPPAAAGGGVAIPAAPKAPNIGGAPVSQARPAAPVHDGPFPIAVVQAPQVRNANDPTQRLADLKAALESDPRPRYVVIKDGMDHGPFSAVEVLQQIATGNFTGDNPLRDSILNEERFIKDWEQFAPYAEQAKLNRDIKQEKKNLEAVVVAERKGTQYKALIGLAVIGVLGAGFAGWLLSKRGSKDDSKEVQGDSVVAVEVDAGLGKGKSGPAGGGGVVGGGGGKYPTLGGGMSCEGAQARYVEDYSKDAPPDLTAGAYGNVLNRGTYLNACSVPPSVSVNVCAAVQNGRAVGVTVTTNPSNPGLNSCIAGQVRGLSFPSHPRLDVSRTSFAAQ